VAEEKILSFADKPIILSKVFAFCCWWSKYFFSQEGNVSFKVSKTCKTKFAFCLFSKSDKFLAFVETRFAQMV